MSHRGASAGLSRREFVVGMGMSGVGLAAGGPRSLRAAGPERRPNILMLVTDDQRWDTMGCMGNPIIRTPNMDALAGGGVLFENAFVTTSICMASRTSIFTGLYERAHGCTFGTPPLAERAWAMSYPARLRKAGYRTGFIGKFGVNLPKASTRFDDWRGFGGQGKYEHTDEAGKPRHLTQIMGDQAVAFLRGCPRAQPFCLSVSFKAPHCQDRDPRQFIPDPAYKDLYRDIAVPVSKTGEARYFEALPECLRNSEGRERWYIRFADPEMHQRSVKDYYRLITGVDTVIGRIRDELKRLKLDDNTVIVLIGDNGFYLGERGLAGKWYAHEVSIRVPLLIYDPRLPADGRGRRLPQMALNVDVAPTILTMAGLDVSAATQGRSLLPLLAGQTCRWRTDFFYEHLFERQNIPKSEGVRTERWKYMRFFEQQPVYEELYNLKRDSQETDNLAASPAHRETLTALRKRCDDLRDHWARGRIRDE